MTIQGIYVKLAVDYADDPKVAALTRFGAPDAGLARDLFVQMICYSKRMLTDGFVPVEQIARLVFPVSQADGEQLAKQLAQVGLIREEANAEQHGYQVLAYCKRNGTRKSTEELQAKRAAAGRIGGRSRRSKPQRKQSAKQNQAQTETETETQTEPLTGSVVTKVKDQSSPETAAPRARRAPARDARARENPADIDPEPDF